MLHRKLYRSGVMAGLTSDDIAALSGLAIQSIFDLRNTSERAAHPTPWQALGVVEYDYGHDDRLSGDLFALLTDPLVTPLHVRDLMLQLYRELPFEHATSYRKIMLRIADGRLPLVFHCSAGKDRTGALAALIMTLLDVREEDVMHDYLMTNHVADHRASVLFRRSQEKGSPTISEALWVPLLHADPDYLQAMFLAIEARAGGIDRYFTDVLGLDEQHIAAIRTNLVASDRDR